MRKSFMGGESFQGVGAGNAIDKVLDGLDLVWGNVGEVGLFGEPEADEAVCMFDGAFLPGCVGVGVVDGGVDNVFEAGLVEKLGAVVERKGADGEGKGAHDVAKGAMDGGLGYSAQGAEDGVACFALVKHKEAAPAIAAGNDTITLKVADIASQINGFGAVFNASSFR